MGKLECTRDILNGFDKNADSDMVQTEVVSDGDEGPVGNCSKDDSVTF